MDKYEFNIKVEQIKKLVNKSDFETAMKIADTIDWRRVRNANLLSMIASVYEKNEEYQEAKDILLIAFERAPIGKRLLYKLTQLALKQGNIQEAESYYREFCELAGDDSRQDILRYLILKAKGAPIEQLIHSLESYTSTELDEKWLYELADLYNQAGMEEQCVKTCDKIMLMFGLGQYVDKAMELKLQYAPLTKYQMDLVENRDKYEEKLRQVEQNSAAGMVSQEEVSIPQMSQAAVQGQAGAPIQPGIQGQPAAPIQPGAPIQAGIQGQPAAQFQPGIQGQPAAQFQAGIQGQPAAQFQPSFQDQLGAAGQPVPPRSLFLHLLQVYCAQVPHQNRRQRQRRPSTHPRRRRHLRSSLLTGRCRNMQLWNRYLRHLRPRCPLPWICLPRRQPLFMRPRQAARTR